jgi:hypothetical protein
VIALNCPNCNQQGQIDFAAINTGFQAGRTYHQNATLDTAEGNKQAQQQQQIDYSLSSLV